MSQPLTRRAAFLALFAFLLGEVGCRRAEVDYEAKPETLEFFPPAGLLPANGRLVLEERNADELHLKAVERLGPRLVPENGEAVPLRLQQYVEGAYAAAEAVLTPSRPLEPGRNYRFELATEPSFVPYPGQGHGVPARAPTGWASMRPEQRRWAVEAQADETPPRWGGPPELLGSTRCGVIQRFSGRCFEVQSLYSVRVPVTDEGGALMIRAEITSGPGQAARSYLLRPQGGVITVGYDYWSGPFRWEAGKRYQLHLVAVDAAGNESPAPGEPLGLTGFTLGD